MRDYAPVIRPKRGKGPHGKRELRRIRQQRQTEHEREAIAARRRRNVGANLPVTIKTGEFL